MVGSRVARRGVLGILLLRGRTKQVDGTGNKNWLLLLVRAELIVSGGTKEVNARTRTVFAFLLLAQLNSFFQIVVVVAKLLAALLLFQSALHADF